MITIEKQLSAFLDNRPGMLARTCQALAKEQINILALSISDTVDHSVVRLVVDDPQKAAKILKDLHQTVQERAVICMELPNAPGELAAIMQKLTEAGINLEYAYCTSPSGQQSGRLVLRTNNIDDTISALS